MHESVFLKPLLGKVHVDWRHGTRETLFPTCSTPELRLQPNGLSLV